jgi:glycosyltransferase involved in cell wall biosynthesis
MDSLGSRDGVKPKIMIDARMVEPHPHGIGRYVKNLATGLAELAETRALDYEPVFLTSHKGLLPDRFETIAAQSKFLNPVELLEIPRILREKGAHLYHSPSFSSLAFSPCPWIVTVHDLNHLHFGDWKKRAYYRLLLKKFSKNARALLTVSEFAKKEIVEWLDISSEQVEVVYNALDHDFTKALSRLDTQAQADFDKLALRKNWRQVRAGNYFVCLSNPKPHKNLRFLAEAYLRARKKSTDTLPPLLLSVDPSEIGIHDENIICTSHLDDGEARKVLQNARAAFFPALYEGFGLPPLEALMSGTPVFVSDIPPHREGLQDFGVTSTQWLDPRSQEQWLEAFQSFGRLLAPEQLRGSSQFLSERESALNRFSVRRLAAHMDQIYTRVVKVI